MFNSLRDFIAHLEKKGELKRVKTPVSPHLEMTEIGTRLIRENGPAVLFENVVMGEDRSPSEPSASAAASHPLRRSVSEASGEIRKPSRGHPIKPDLGKFSGAIHKDKPIPVLINLFGTVSRVAAGMGTTPDKLREIGETLALLRNPEPPGGWKEAVGMLPMLKKIMTMKPKEVKKAPCQEVVLTGDDINLGMFPIQTCWPGDAAPLITWPLVVTKGLVAGSQSSSLRNRKNPKTDSRQPTTDNYNLGIYRMQVIGRNQVLMRWLKHRGGAQHYNKWQKEKSNAGLENPVSHEPAKRRPMENLEKFSGDIYNKGMPVAAVIGADPATILAAVTPVPDTLSEYDFAGFLRGKGVDLVECKTVPLKVPAEAEIVLEGHVSFEDYRDEGPFGDHTGYYNSVEKFPVFTISAITMRKDPIYLSTYTGKPPDEPSVLGESLNEVFIPLFQQQFPEIVDFWLPPEGCSYRIAVVSIKKTYPGQAKRIMMGVWSYLRQFIYTKWVIVVDDDINIRDWKEVMWAISTRMDFGRDTTIIENTPIDYLDFASPESGLGAKMGFDATNKIGPETKREWGEKIEMDEKVKEKIDRIWAGLGL